jgi:hypothetical protein
MLNKFRAICLIMFTLLSISVIYCQETEAAIPDSTVIKISSEILTLLLNNDSAVTGRIVWESLILNDYDCSDDYWEAYDYEEADYFVEDMIFRISTMLHYEGDTEDKFSDWTVTRTADNISVKSHNKKKEVEFIYKPGNTTYTDLYIINISDIDN